MGKYGLVYIAHNPRDGKNVFKVGKTERDIVGRMAELTASTSNIGKYSPLAYFIVSDIDAAERACHSRLAQYRVQENREFFEADFSHLLRLVQDQVDPYLARSLVPETSDSPTGESLAPIPLSARIKNKRNRAKEEAEAKKSQEEEAKESATKLLQDWMNDLPGKVELIKKEFADVPFIRWMEPQPKVLTHNILGIAYVQLLADTQDHPVRLLFRGFESSYSAHPRKEAKVLAYESSSSAGFGRMMLWEEEDDHLVAEIKILIRLDDKRWKASVGLRAVAVNYDSYKCDWKKSDVGSATQINAEEAIDLLTAILANYAGNPIRIARKIIRPAELPKETGWRGEKLILHTARGPSVQEQWFKCPLLSSR